MIPFDFEFFWRNLLAFVIFIDWCVGLSVTTGGAFCSLFLKVEFDELFGRLALVVSLAGGLTLPVVNFFPFSFVFVLRILLYLWDGGGEGCSLKEKKKNDMVFLG